MIRNLQLIDSGRSAPPAWPSIAAASAELRRPRRLTVVPRPEAAPAAALSPPPRLKSVPGSR